MVGGADCDRGNMQQMVQQAVDHAIWGISLCAVVMIVEIVSCRKLCCVIQFIQAKNFHPWYWVPVNAGVWWWCTETASLVERVHRVQKWVGIHHGDCTSQHSRSRKCEHSTNGGTGFGKPTRQFEIYPLPWSYLWKLCPKLSMYNWNTAVGKVTKTDVLRCSFTSSVI